MRAIKNPVLAPRSFVLFSLCAGALAIILYVGVCVHIDPFNLFHVIGPGRYVSIEGRFSKPAIARAAAYDSYVAGCSISEEFGQEDSNRLLGVRFGNLTMGGATSREQLNILRVLPSKKYKVLLMEVFYENYGADPEDVKPGFPGVLYDGNRFNDIQIYFQFNLWLLKELYHAFIWNHRGADPNKEWHRLGADGYFGWESLKTWDATTVRRYLFHSIVFRENRLALSTVNFQSLLATEGKRFEHVLLYFPPLHADALEAQFAQSRWDNQKTYIQWKRDVIRIAAQYPNVILIDYQTLHPYARRDENFWTYNHFRSHLREMILEDFVSYLRTGRLAHPDFGHVADAAYGDRLSEASHLSVLSPSASSLEARALPTAREPKKPRAKI